MGRKLRIPKVTKKSSGKAKVNSFDIKVSGSDLLDSLDANIACSNIALMLFEGFTNEEKAKYTQIGVELNQNSSTTTDLIFTPDVLIGGLLQLGVFKDFSKMMLEKDYERVVNRVDPKYLEEDVLPRFTKYVQNLTDEHGDIVDFKRVGYGKMTYPDGTSAYQFSGHFEFKDGYNRSYFVLTSTDKDNKHIQGYNLSGK
ncbi:MAG TPA: hypothetical protein EYG86_07210 [Crocinitomicaceae bacterium]|nr:hypothetical protein [Crocinitomicaceae bacterium]